MVSIHTNQLAGGAVMFGSKYAASALNQSKKTAHVQVGSEFIRFGTQIQTDFRQTIDAQHAVFRCDPLDNTDIVGLTRGELPDFDLSPETAKSLVGPDDYFGVDKTSQRIADFVLDGAQDDIELLKAGREGILKGFGEAKKAWGGALPKISYDTLEKSLAAIDEKIESLGGSIVDLSA